MPEETKDERELPALSEAQEQLMKDLIREGFLDFEIQSINPGWWSYDIAVVVDHDEFMEATHRRAFTDAESDSRYLQGALLLLKENGIEIGSTELIAAADRATADARPRPTIAWDNDLGSGVIRGLLVGLEQPTTVALITEKAGKASLNSTFAADAEDGITGTVEDLKLIAQKQLERFAAQLAAML